MLCPYFSNRKFILEDVYNVCIMIKYGNVYEPIYQFSGEKNPKKFTSNGKYISSMINIFKKRCSLENPSKLLNVAQTYTSDMYKAKVDIETVYDTLNTLKNAHVNILLYFG